MERLALIALVTVLLLTEVEGQTVIDSKKLVSDKLEDYTKSVRPVYFQSSPVKVNVSMYVLNIVDFNEVLETISFGGLLVLVWHDISMMWDPSKYGGLTTFTTSYKNVWVPDLILINPSDEIASLGSDWQQVRFYSSGSAKWYPGDIMTTTCTVDVTQFPFDTQRCAVDFLPWGYSQKEIVLIPTIDNVDLSLYSPNGAWTFVNGTAETIEFAESSKYRVTFELARKPLFIVVNVLLPIAFLSVLNVLVFIIPVDSGERISYCITVLLAIAVFFTIVSDTLPKSSEPMPIIAYILMLELIISSCITFFTILNLRLYFHDENDEVPAWVIKTLSCCRCVPRSCCKKSKGKGNEKADGNAEIFNVKSESSKLKSVFLKNRVSPLPKETDGSDTRIHNRELHEESTKEDMPEISWKIISAFVDKVLFVAFVVLNAASFTTYVIVAKYY